MNAIDRRIPGRRGVRMAYLRQSGRGRGRRGLLPRSVSDTSSPGPRVNPVCESPWDVPHGNFRIGLDMLGAFFLLPVLVLSALAAVYGGQLSVPFRGKKSLAASWFFLPRSWPAW